MITNYLLRDGLDGFGWLTRNSWRDGELSFGVNEQIRIDWERVDRSCASAILSCCLGYSRYAFKPNAMLNELGRHSRDFTDKMKSASFDREYANQWEFDEDRISPFRENWLGVQVVRHWNIHGTYTRHYRSLFDWRAGRLRLACENYRFAKGRYPTELAELVPDCIAAVPLDPYDGQPIRYNAEHGYFWTPGPDAAFDGKVDFDGDGYPRWKNRNYHFVQLLDTTKVYRPPSTYCNMSRRNPPKRTK